MFRWLFGTKFRIVKDTNDGMFRIQQKSFGTAYTWVFVRSSAPVWSHMGGTKGYRSLEEAKAAVERMQKPRFEVVSEE